MPEALLTLFAAFITGTVLSRDLWDGMVAPLTGYLDIYVIGFAAFFCLMYLQRTLTPRREKKVFFVTLFAFGLILFIVANRQILIRRQLLLPQHANDGIVQSVEAAKFLLRGQNPYSADFSTTPFGVFNAAIGDGPIDGAKPRNLAADHYVYLPMVFLVQTPLVLFSRITGSGVDYQTWPLVFFLATVIILMWVSRTWNGRTRLLLLTIGNPFLWVYAMGGFSEFMLSFFLGLSIAVLDRRRMLLGSIAFGLALATKQTAWLLMPLYFYWIWHIFSGNKKLVWRYVGLVAAVAGSALLPFFLWNPGAMYDDTIRYLSGTVPWSYPIANATLAQYLVQFGIVKNPRTPISLWPLQLFAYAATSWALYYWLKRNITTSRVFTAAAVITLVATITNRVGADNYFMVPLLLSIFSYAYYVREQAVAEKERTT